MSLKLTSARPDWANRFAKKLKSADVGDVGEIHPGSSRHTQTGPGTPRVFPAHPNWSRHTRAFPGTPKLVPAHPNWSRHTQGPPAPNRPAQDRSGAPRDEFAQEAPKQEGTRPPQVPAGPPQKVGQKKARGCSAGYKLGSSGGAGLSSIPGAYTHC